MSHIPLSIAAAVLFIVVMPVIWCAVTGRMNDETKDEIDEHIADLPSLPPHRINFRGLNIFHD